jgi:prolyl-tRNA synthetase
VEAEIKDELKVTIRCIPFDAQEEDGSAYGCGRASVRVLFAKSY